MKKENIINSKLSWTFLDGSTRNAVMLESITIGKGRYLPGWQWSKHVGAMTGKKSETHIGYIMSGKMIIRDSSDKEMNVGPGDAFEMGPNHDAWVVGDKPCIALDFECLRKK